MLETKKYYCVKCRKIFWYTMKYDNELPRCPKCKSVTHITDDDIRSLSDILKEYLQKIFN